MLLQRYGLGCATPGRLFQAYGLLFQHGLWTMCGIL